MKPSHAWLFIADVTERRSSWTVSEVCRGLLSARIQPNAAKLTGQHFKDAMKATTSF